MRVLAQDPTLADFGKDSWWLIIINILVVFVFGMSMILLGVWFERRVVVRLAGGPRLHPDRPLGLLQTVADRLQGMLQEDPPTRAAEQVGVIFLRTVFAVSA